MDAAAQRAPQDGLVKLATDRDGREVHRLGKELRQQRALEPDARPRRELVAARQHPPSRGRSGGNEASDVAAAAAGRDRAIPRDDVFLGSVRFIGPEPCAPRFRRLARGRPRVFLVQERDLPLLHRAPARASVVVGPRRCLEGAEAVHEPLLRALGPPLDGRVAAGRGGRVQVEGDGGTDAISLAGALEHRPRLGRIDACRTASGFRRRRGEGAWFLSLARALATGRDGGRLAMGASSLGGELRVEETLEPPAREHLRVAVADPRPRFRVRLDVHRGHKLGPRAQRHHPERVQALVTRHDSREHRLSTSPERIGSRGLGHGRERGVVGGDGGLRDVIGEDA